MQTEYTFLKRVGGEAGEALHKAVTIHYKVVRLPHSETHTMRTFFHGEDSECRIYHDLRGRDIYDKEGLDSQDKAQLHNKSSALITLTGT